MLRFLYILQILFLGATALSSSELRRESTMSLSPNGDLVLPEGELFHDTGKHDPETNQPIILVDLAESSTRYRRPAFIMTTLGLVLSSLGFCCCCCCCGFAFEKLGIDWVLLVF